MGNNAPDQKKSAYQFILKNRAGALATADKDGVPHVAIIYCIVNDDLSLYFSTRVEGRKFKNMMARPVVGLAFMHEKTLETIQLTGIAARVDNLKKEQEVLFNLIKMRYKEPNWPVPPIKLFQRGATNELAIMKVTPGEMTHASFKTLKNGRYKPFFTKII